MGDNSFPWRDIYSNEAWAKILSLQRPEAHPNAEGLKNIGEVIARYHSIPKDEKQGIEARRSLLEEIGALAQHWTQTPGVKTDKGDAKKFKAGGEGSYIKELGPWIASLEKRAKKKSQYLLDIKTFLDDNKHASTLSTAAKFLEYLNRKQRKRAQDQPTMSLVPGNRVEKIDPFHRGGAEFSLDRNNEITPTTNPISKSLCRWLENNSDTPFFLWLEKTAICLATPGLDNIWDEEFRRVKKTWYSGEQPGVYLITIQGPTLMCLSADGDEDQNLQLFDTRKAKVVKGEVVPIGQYAFAWATDGSIYSAEHKAGKLHHSSFTAGRKVRAAGMWSVVDGKVMYVDDNTGHYQTDAYHLYDFLDFLDKQHLIADGGVVAARTIKLLGTEAGESRIPIKTLLQRYANLEERKALRAGVNTASVKAAGGAAGQPQPAAAAAAATSQPGLTKDFFKKFKPPGSSGSSSGSSSSSESS